MHPLGSWTALVSEIEPMTREASRFWGDFELAAMDEQISLFRDYLHVMEGFLEAEAEKHREQAVCLRRERYDRLRQESSQFDPTEPLPSEEAWAGNQEQMIEAIFASILRRSFFISLYAFLESRLVEECRYQEQWGKTKLPLTDVTSGGIDKAKDCLKGQVDFGGREWQEIRKLQRLRNFVVHCGNSFENVKSACDERCLKEYVAQEQALSLRWKGIVFHEGFCENALDTIDRFLKLL